ncbi:MAG TPA: ABC transporter permease [Chloroflexota bacterium]|nr:ABC transporter permease [Chloroflexota bacterium]
MLAFVIRRLGFLVIVVIGVSMLTFAMSHLVPADPARLLLGKTATPAQITQIRRGLGLDQPVPVQYLIYMDHLLHGDFGQSISSRRPVLSDFLDYFPATVELTLYAMLMALVVGIPLGVLSAVWRGGWLDHFTRVTSLFGVSIPLFWLGLLFQLIFFGWLHILPSDSRLDGNVAAPHHITGMYTVDSLLTANWPALFSSLDHVLLPAATLAFATLATVIRVTRSSMIEALGKDYIRTARAKGVARWRVNVRHALRNALIPTITLVGLQFGNLLGGAFLVEIVFSWPGIGFYSVQAIRNFDYAAIMGITIIVAIAYTVINLVVDLLYAVLDPRITYA